MMEMNRRGFFRTLLAVGAAAIGPKWVFPAVHRVYAAKFSDIVATTLKRRQGEIVASILAHNALLKKLQSSLPPRDPGALIEEPLSYGEKQIEVKTE